MNFVVKDDNYTWIFNYIDPKIKFPSFKFMSDTDDAIFV